MKELSREEKKKLKIGLCGLVIVTVLVLAIIILAIIKSGNDDESYTAQTVTEETEKDTESQNEDITDALPDLAEEAGEKERIDSYLEARKSVSFHLEGYMKNIFGGWEWTMQEQITAYVKEQGIDAENAVVLLYNGYDANSDTHSFYLQLDDKDGTVLLGTYHPYESKVQPSDKTLDEILKEKESQGDAGEPDELPEETVTPSSAPTATPEPTKAPVIPYTDLQILEVPTELADFLGANAPNLPAGLAGFLAANNNIEGNQYATYTGEYQISGNKAVFDVELKNKTVIHVVYDGEYTFEFQ